MRDVVLTREQAANVLDFIDDDQIRERLIAIHGGANGDGYYHLSSDETEAFARACERMCDFLYG